MRSYYVVSASGNSTMKAMRTAAGTVRLRFCGAALKFLPHTGLSEYLLHVAVDVRLAHGWVRTGYARALGVVSEDNIDPQLQKAANHKSRNVLRPRFKLNPDCSTRQHG